MLKVTDIRMDYLSRPVGLAQMPHFSWVIESDKSNVIQQGYQLQIGKDPLFFELFFDSGWTESEESAHVAVCTAPLQSCTGYYVRVRIRDNEEESGFCEPDSFVMAIRNQEEWKADFISGESPADKEKSGGTYLRTEIEAAGEIESAYVCTTALGIYHFYINGEKVGRDEMSPGWTSYRKHLCYQTHEVTHMLKPGTNALGAFVGAGWYKGEMGFLHRRNNYGERTAFLMQLVIRFRDGRKEYFYTGNSWRTKEGPVLFSEIYGGEYYDAGKEIKGWNETGLNTESWKAAAVVDFPKAVLTAQPGSKVCVADELPVKELLITPKGETVLDFGQNLTGRVEFRAAGSRGDMIRLKCFEVLDDQGNVYTDNLRKAKQEITYIPGDYGQQVYHPYFTFQGFRYVQVLSWPGAIRKEDFTAQTLHSEMEPTGTFSCSHPLLNQLQHNILWSLKGNFLDIPTDCPQRDERMGWTGDAQIFCRTACYLMNSYPFFRKWLKDLACDQTKEGGVPHMVPDIISGNEKSDWLLSQGTHSAAAWADAAVINPWTLYLTYGDKVILEEQYDSMKKWIDFMREHAVEDIWNYKLQFGDWVALDAEEGSYFGATPNDLTCTAYYAYSTELFAKTAKILKRREDADRYEKLYLRIRKKFRDTFFEEDGSMTAMTQTAHILALYFNLVPEEYREKTAAKLKVLLDQKNGHLVTGFVGTPYFCHALSQNGYVKEAYELLLKEDFPSWLYQIKMGATTIWEHWDGLKPDGTMWSPDMNSFNHYAYGAVGEWLYRVILGIEVDEKDPGYHHAIIAPETGMFLTFAEGSYKSGYGSLRVRWDKLSAEEEANKKIRLQVTIPHNTTAAIILENGAEVLTAEGITFRLDKGRNRAECGSGCHTILYLIENSAGISYTGIG